MARIRFFNIKNSGFFEGKKKTPEFGELISVIKELSIWGENATEVINTATHQKMEGHSIVQSYLYDIHQNGNDFLITLWHEQTNSRGKVIALNGMNKLGAMSVVTSDFSGVKKPIPGVPGYYVIFGDQKVCVSVVHDEGSISSKRELEMFIKGFMHKFWPFTNIVKEDDGDGKLVDIYKYSATAGNYKRLNPRFSIEVTKNRTKIDMLLNNVDRVKGLVTEEIIESYQLDDRSNLRKLIGRVKGNNPIFEGESLYRQELKCKLSKENINQIVADYENDISNAVRSKFHRVGFMVDSSVVMVSDAIAEVELDLANVSRVNGVYNAEALLSKIVLFKQHALSLQLKIPDVIDSVQTGSTSLKTVKA